MEGSGLGLTDTILVCALMDRRKLHETWILKLSIPCTLAVNHFFLFQLNAHTMWNTYIYHQLPPTCFGVCYTIFRKTIALLARKMYAFCNVAIKFTTYTVFFLIYNAVIMFKTICISSFFNLETLKMLVKILSCSTLLSVGSCYILCMLAIYVCTVSSCVWVRNGVEILRWQ